MGCGVHIGHDICQMSRYAPEWTFISTQVIADTEAISSLQRHSYIENRFLHSRPFALLHNRRLQYGASVCCRIDYFSTKAVSLLQSRYPGYRGVSFQRRRFLFYRTDSSTTGPMHLLQTPASGAIAFPPRVKNGSLKNAFTAHFFTTATISLLQNRFLYYSEDFCTAWLIPRLQGRFLYIAIPSRQSRVLYYNAHSFTTAPMAIP